MDSDFLEESFNSDKGLTAEQRRTLEGLLFVLNHEADTALRVKAVRALSQIEEMSALHALAETALYEEDEAVRREAHAALVRLFGEESDAFLQSVRLEYEGQDEEEDNFPPSSPLSAPENEPLFRQDASAYAAPPVIQEERTPLWVWAVVVVFILAGIVFFMLR
ncbi:MAG: HEAT repeat domain-containing protein [Chloroflexota bacterium]